MFGSSAVQNLRRVFVCLAVGLLLLLASGLTAMKLTGRRALTVVTDSMQPVLAPNDLIIVRPPDEVKVGQVVTYISGTNPGRLTTHRVVRINTQEQTIVTKGDNVAVNDWPIRPSEIIGAAEMRLPGIGRWFNWLRQPLGLIVGLYFPCLVIIAAEVLRLAKGYHARKSYQYSRY